MKFNNKIYLVYDKKLMNPVDSFVADNKEVAARFMSIRVKSAFEAKNHGLLTIWRDCEIWEVSFSDSITAVKVMDLSEMIPAITPEEAKEHA